MKSWSLEENSHGYRLEFYFVDAAGCQLRSKTWELRRENHEPAKAMLLQANAKLLARVPGMRTLGPNYVRITVSVAEISGELAVTAFDGVSNPEAINKQIATYPVTLAVVMDSGGLHFTLYRDPNK